MKLHIKGTKIELTPSINTYVENKIGSLVKFLKEWDRDGVAELWVEIGRTTKHHNKGNVFRAEADIRLPKKILRAEHEDSDIRVAIDKVREKLLKEIQTYKAAHQARARKERASRTRG